MNLKRQQQTVQKITLWRSEESFETRKHNSSSSFITYSFLNCYQLPEPPFKAA